MQVAISEAMKSEDDVPVGAVLVDGNANVIAVSHNRKEVLFDATSHAEVEVIRSAGESLGRWRLMELTLVVTLEPCVMCAGAIVAARISNLVFGAWDLPAGGSGSRYDITRDSALGNPVNVIGGILEQECEAQLQSYFQSIRKKS